MARKLISNRTLGKIAVYGAIGVISSVMYMRYKIQERIRNTEYFRQAFTKIRSTPGAVHLLGEPIKELGFDLSDANKNNCDGEIAKFEVNIRGPKDKGIMYFWSTRTDDGWKLDRLELEVNSQPEKRFLIKKEGEDK